MIRGNKFLRKSALALCLAAGLGAAAFESASAQTMLGSGVLRHGWAVSMCDDQGYAVSEEGYQPRSDDAAENPSEGPVRLARFAYLQGEVTWREDENAAWSSASVNLPIRQGAQVWVPEHGRAEIQFDDGSILRLGSGALVTLQTLYSDAEGEFTEVKLSEGLASLRLRHEKSVYQIDTPFVSVKTTGPSKIRVGAGSAVEVAVRQGDATIEGSQGREDLHAGDYVYLADADASYEVRGLPGADSWEQWNTERDRALDVAASRPSSEYLPPNIALVQPNLDEYGTWRDDADYGHVWCPRVVETSWRPYYNGRWTWVEPFGWTWVSNEAWGWAPYHYGTWVSRPYGWAWCPGPVTQYWSPAVVHFCEVDNRVAWCALSPSEVRYPPSLAIGLRLRNWSAYFSIGGAAVYYPTSERICEARPWSSVYINRRRTTINNVTNIYNDNRVTYVQNNNTVRNLNFVPVNARIANGATLADRVAFGGRGSFRAVSRDDAGIFRQGVAVTAPTSRQAPVAGPAMVRPTAYSAMPTRTATPQNAPSAAVANRSIYRAALPRSVQRAAGDTGRAPAAQGTRSTGGYTGGRGDNPNGGYTGGVNRQGRSANPNGGYTGGANRQGSRTAPPTANRSSAGTQTPDNTTANPGAPQRRNRDYPAGRASGTVTPAQSPAERARAARESVGAGRRYGGTRSETPASNGTGRQPYSAPNRSGSGDTPATTPRRSTGDGGRYGTPRTANPPTRDTGSNAPPTRAPERSPSPEPERRSTRPYNLPTRSEPPSRPAEPSRTSEPRREMPTRSEPRSEPRREAPTRSEPRSEPRREAPTRSEPSRSEPRREAPTRSEPSRSEPSRRSDPAPDSRGSGDRSGAGRHK